jgi:hypothetical protein
MVILSFEGPDQYAQAGGLGVRVAGHMLDGAKAFSYMDFPDSASMQAKYLQLIGQLHTLMQSAGLNAAVYTQPYDVENEVNGLRTYDRRVAKVDVKTVYAAQRALIQASEQLNNGPAIATS